MEQMVRDPDLSVGWVICTHLDDNCLRGRDEGICHEKDYSIGKADHKAAKDKWFRQDDSGEAEKAENLSGCAEG